ncbi:MAG: terminase small subunit [Nitrospira sp.]
MKLQPKHHAFVDEYLVDRNGAQAAIRAGYSPTCARQTASRLLAHADIKDEIAKRLSRLAQSHEITRETVLAGLLRAIQLAEDTSQPGAAARGWAEINKMLGFHEPVRAEVQVTPGGERYQRYLESATDEELLALVGGKMREE